MKAARNRSVYQRLTRSTQSIWLVTKPSLTGWSNWVKLTPRSIILRSSGRTGRFSTKELGAPGDIRGRNRNSREKAQNAQKKEGEKKSRKADFHHRPAAR